MTNPTPDEILASLASFKQRARELAPVVYYPSGPRPVTNGQGAPRARWLQRRLAARARGLPSPLVQRCLRVLLVSA